MGQIPSWASEFECTELEPDRAAFKAAVETWAADYDLNAAWVKEEVFSTLQCWLQPGRARTWYFRGPDPAAGFPALPRLLIDEQWSGQPWPEYRKHLLTKIASFGSDVKKHSELMKLGRGEARTRLPEHYEWAARFQCAKLAPQTIANQANRNPPLCESTVTKAVNSVLEAICLRRRHRKSGRKPKAKT